MALWSYLLFHSIIYYRLLVFFITIINNKAKGFKKMKMRVRKEDILKTLQQAQSAINPRAGLPILSNLLIEAESGNVKLTGTDLDIGIISNSQADIEVKGAITVPAKKFADIIRELPDETLSMSVKKNNVVIIESGNTVFKIMGLPKEEYPKLPEFTDAHFVLLQQNTLKTMLGMTSFAISRDETRYILNGILFLIEEDKLTMVATDGRRLSLIKKEFKAPKNLKAKFIVPAKTATELLKTLEDTSTELKMTFTKNQVLFDLGQTIIISRLIEGEYPNYEQVIPKEAKEKLTIDRERLLSAAKRASLLTTQDSLAVRLDIHNDKIVVSKSTPDVGESKEELGAEYNGSHLSIGFNPSYLMDVLKNINIETVAIELFGPDKPGVIRLGDEYTYVLLPMQLV